MKSVKFAVLLAFVLSLSATVFARDNKTEGKFTLSDSVQLGSTQLKPGDYKAAWEGTGSDVQVKILQGKNVVATTSAKLVDKSDSQDSVSVSNANGSKKLEQIDFGGIRKALVFSSAVTAQN
ncbi:MAG TPA: hypothetical protein VK466_15400 [Terriglobales bacterium]|nr:hypothetical protein [Terriglobales bacterium]